MHMLKIPGRWAGPAVFLAAALWVCAAKADIIIVATDVATYKRGQVLQDNDTLDIPAGSRVTVLLSTNAIREIKGPVQQKVADLSKGRPSVATSLWQQVVGFFSTGGTSTSPGATRAFDGRAGAGPSRDAWKAIPLDVGDVACLESGKPVKIARNDTQNALNIKISDANLTGIATVSFPAGQAEAAWPAEIPAASGSYILTIPAFAPKRFNLKMLAPASLEGEGVLENLEREGCRAQLKLWLQIAASQ